MPSNIVNVNLVLVGHYAGQTIVLGGRQFTDGALRLQGEEKEVEGVVKYLGKCYQAYPENSIELQSLREQLGEDSNGGSEDNGTVQKTGEQIDSGVRQDGSESPSVPDLLGETDVGSDGGTEGSIPNGDGHEDTGLHREEETGRNNEDQLVKSVMDPQVRKLHKTIMALDPENDSHWSEEGLPAMAAIEMAMESTGILRAEVELAAPEFTRDTAREEAAKFSTDDL